MVRYKLLLLPVLCLFLMQSCVHGDLDDCPPMVRYAVAFKYTNHIEKEDRFYDDVKKINLYVFDSEKFIYKTDTVLSPYEENFNIPLDLPMGKYYIIAWGNVLNDQPYFIDQFVKGVTTLNEAKLTLQRKADNLSDLELGKLFYGEIETEIPLYVSRIDTISLINDTKHVRVVLYWDNTEALEQDATTIDYNDVTVRLSGNNAVYDFDNKFLTNTVTYSPFATDLTGAILDNDRKANWLNLYYYPDSLKNIADSTVFDFKILRMLLDNEIRLIVLRKNPITSYENLFVLKGDPNRNNTDYGVDIVGTQSAVDGFSRIIRERFGTIPVVDVQNTFDAYENYRVNVYFKYDRLANTYFTGTIKVVEWHKIDFETPAGL